MAHALTLLRLLLVLPVATALARPESLPRFLLLALLGVAIATDYLDGRVARQQGTASAAGQLFDHATDFVFVTAGLAAASAAGRVTGLLPVVIALAFSQYVVDSYLFHRRKQLRMSTIGRWNGILYFVPLVVLAVSDLDLLGSAAVLATAASGIGYALVASTVVSMIDRAVAPRVAALT